MPPDNQCTTCTPPNTILGCWPPTQTDDPCTLVFGTASISFACPTASCICDENNVCYSPNSNPADYGFAFFPICTTPTTCHNYVFITSNPGETLTGTNGTIYDPNASPFTGNTSPNCGLSLLENSGSYILVKSITCGPCSDIQNVQQVCTA
uniref:Uncharacterized protein n=1 Tax=Acrobeloides nanus TaxID=290746 RepID=A0A914CQW4_9BILA